jgi:uncharacterized membrane protein HdeD (DUF308 family)
MATTLDNPLARQLRHDLEALRGNWVVFVLLGVVLLIVGFVALGSVVVASLATAMVIGILLIVGGSLELAGSFWSRAWSGFFAHMLCGVLSIVVGALFLKAPVGALLALTLLLASLLLVGGIFRVVAALTHRFSGWGWTVAGGVIDLALGTLIALDWPEAALWVVGMFVGISLVFRGSNWISLGLAVRALPTPVPE